MCNIKCLTATSVCRLFFLFYHHLNNITYWQLQILCDRFGIDCEGGRAEYDVMTNIMHNEYSNLSPTEMMETTASKLGDLIPKMAKLAAVALVLPVSTAGG